MIGWHHHSIAMNLSKLWARKYFMPKMDTIEDRNGKDLTEEEINKRWQEYTEEL